MKKSVGAGLFSLCLLPFAYGGTIDFETNAPPLFVDTIALSNTYAGLGVTFVGPSDNSGGAIVDVTGNWGVIAHSGTDFLGFNEFAHLSDGGIPIGPETILFGSPVSNVGLWVGGTNGGSPIGTAPVTEYTLLAFDSSNALIGSAVIQPVYGEWSQLTINVGNISSLVLSYTTYYAIVDDLSWEGNAVPEPASLLLLGTGLGAVGLAVWRRRK